jgi:hypothetical protein
MAVLPFLYALDTTPSCSLPSNKATRASDHYRTG